MATNYPTAKDDGTSLPNPSSSSATNSPSHSSLHSSENAAIIAVETKLGTGSTTPASNTLLFGTGAGTSAWQTLTSSQLASVLSDETGTGSVVFANTPTLITPKVDTINESTLNNGVTVGGVNLKSGFMSGANLTAGTVGSSQVATGVPVQIVATNFSGVATGTTLIPRDNTIPQNTEGDQYMTQAITPKASTNRLRIEATAYCSSTVSTDLTLALFQDSTANALAASAQWQATTTAAANVKLVHDMLAGTASATTFKIRIGGSGAGTVTFNGLAGNPLYGGITLSNITVTEYKV